MNDRPRTWKPPDPYGYPEALNVAGTVAAPLLTGFAITLIVLVLQAGSNMRAPGLALMLLAATVVVLLGSIQAAFVARLYYVTPTQITEWWFDKDDPERLDRLIADQTKYDKLYRRRAAWFRRSYNVGVSLLLAAVTVIMMPPTGSHHQVERWTGCGVLAIGFFLELAWVVGTWAEQLGPPWYDG